MKKILKAMSITLLIIAFSFICIALYIKIGLPHIGPPPDIRVEITAQRVSRGNYLANHVIACMDCHSQRDWNLYAGPIKQGTFGGGGEIFGKNIGFPGTLYSKNITPYGLRNWTDGEIFTAITCGVSRDGKALFPLMGYPAYGQLDKEDIYCIIAYLRGLPEIKNDVPPRKLDFPISLLVNTMPSKAHLSVKPDTGNKIAYGKYLITAANCLECHSQVDKGKRIGGTEYGGGRGFFLPGHSVVYSSNITPDLETGIGRWTESLFVRTFKQYSDTGYKAPQVGTTEKNTPMPWIMYSGMTEQDLSAIYAYLRTVKPLRTRKST